jgi:ATP-dependent DNA helicase RecG
VEFAAPGLVITDEQHRFGVAQRARLSDKNAHAHLLCMSATPIPRSLALVMYGDLAVSRIDTMPPGRQRVDTFVVNQTYRARLDAFICKNVDEGGQVYVVCPAVEEQESEQDLLLEEIGVVKESKPPLQAAVQYAEQLAERLPSYRVAFVHGKLKPREKDEVMNRFAAGEIDILVSTTVIEVGVNVPNACLMIVENAERFGLSQLHQLRGRVGRGKRKSYCVLVAGAMTDTGIGEVARRRLHTMKTTYDGFAIAEQDLAQRGPGDFFAKGGEGAIRQSGGVEFRLASQCSDGDMLTRAFAAADELVGSDAVAEHPALQDAVDRMFAYAQNQGYMN